MTDTRRVANVCGVFQCDESYRAFRPEEPYSRLTAEQSHTPEKGNIMLLMLLQVA